MYQSVFFGNKLINAKDAKLSIASSAVLYGLSVYTVFPVCIGTNGERLAFRLRDHYERLVNSAKIIGIDSFALGWTYESFAHQVQALIVSNQITTNVYVRATVHVDAEIAGTRSRGLSSILSMFVYDAQPILSAEGVRLKTSVWRRIPDNSIPSRAKVNGAYVNSVLAKQDALDSGYDDCIFLDNAGHVCELSAANIFMVRDGVLITPDTTSDLLEGINRRTVIEELAGDLGYKVIERTVDLTELYIADELFASGTSANIAPILGVDGRSIGDGLPGSITRKIQSLHSEVLHGKVKKHHGWLMTLSAQTK
jgi:branched-chain amino acid aminotransferase